MKRALILGALVASFLCGLAVAQTVVLQNLSGSEAVLMQLGGPGGTGAFTTTAALRNSTGYLLVAGGTTVNTSMTNLQAKALALGAITTWNVQLPANPFDGELAEVACPGGAATAAITASSTAVIVGTAFTACSSGGAAANTAEYTYAQSPNTWYRIQ